MIAKYHIEYSIQFGGHLVAGPHEFFTDDPVACEEFLVALLERAITINSIKHEGIPLSQRESDALIRNAATTLAAKHVAKSLGLDSEQVHYRFGLAA